MLLFILSLLLVKLQHPIFEKVESGCARGLAERIASGLRSWGVCMNWTEYFRPLLQALYTILHDGIM